MIVELLLWDRSKQSYEPAKGFHEDHSGVSAMNDRPRRGEFRVKDIQSVSFGYDGDLRIYAHPIERDEAVIEDKLTAVVEEMCGDGGSCSNRQRYSFLGG